MPPHIQDLEKDSHTWRAKTPTTLVPMLQELSAAQRQIYGAHVTQPFLTAEKKTVLFVGQVVGMADRNNTQACRGCVQNNIQRCDHEWCVRWTDQEVSGEWVPCEHRQRAGRATRNRAAGKENVKTGRWSAYLSAKDVLANQLCQKCREPIEEVGSKPKQKKNKKAAAVQQHARSAEVHPHKILLCSSRTGCSGAMHVKCAPGVCDMTQLPREWYCSEACRTNSEKN